MESVNDLQDLLEQYLELESDINNTELSLAIANHQDLVRFIVDGDSSEFEKEIKEILQATEERDVVLKHKNPLLLDIIKLINIHYNSFKELNSSDKGLSTKLAQKIVSNQFITLDELKEVEKMLLDDTKAKEIFREEIKRIENK